MRPNKIGQIAGFQAACKAGDIGQLLSKLL